MAGAVLSETRRIRFLGKRRRQPSPGRFFPSRELAGPSSYPMTRTAYTGGAGRIQHPVLPLPHATLYPRPRGLRDELTADINRLRARRWLTDYDAAELISQPQAENVAGY